MNIGFIGLGNMGAPMARNLAAAGHAVTGFDLDAKSRSSLQDVLTVSSTVTAAARGQDVVITMLPHGPALRAVAAEIIPVMQDGACLIDCSTVDIAAAKDVARRLVDRVQAVTQAARAQLGASHPLVGVVNACFCGDVAQ
ncbi:MAG: NAD(P)-binding domain-containing protein, partial [Candidatus Puniceispirillum sp.]